jgi:hypothetical protein
MFFSVGDFGATVWMMIVQCAVGGGVHRCLLGDVLYRTESVVVYIH